MEFACTAHMLPSLTQYYSTYILPRIRSLIDKTTWLRLRLKHWKLFHFRVVVKQACRRTKRVPNRYKQSHHESSVVVVWQRAPSQVRAGLRFLSSSMVFYKAASTKKEEKMAHFNLSDGQSSLWCWGASKASPTFSKKSMIHPVVNLFFFSHFVFCLIYNPHLLLSVFLPNKACWSLHNTQ